MISICQIVIDGRLTADPTEHKTKETNIASFSLACNHPKEQVSYFTVKTFSFLADNIMKYCKKGMSVTVVGNLRQERWKTPEGDNREKVVIFGTSVRFNSRPKNENDSIQESGYEDGGYYE